MLIFFETFIMVSYDACVYWFTAFLSRQKIYYQISIYSLLSIQHLAYGRLSIKKMLIGWASVGPRRWREPYFSFPGKVQERALLFFPLADQESREQSQQKREQKDTSIKTFIVVQEKYQEAKLTNTFVPRHACPHQSPCQHFSLCLAVLVPEPLSPCMGNSQS